MPTIAIPPPYRGPTAGADEVEVPAGTVAACLDAVEARFPGFRPLVVDDGGQLHRFVKLFRNGDQLTGDALSTVLQEGDRLEVLSAIAGGSGLR
jgi:molybdopterin synthase sulfur carrier subunit